MSRHAADISTINDMERELTRRAELLQQKHDENQRWLTWSSGRYPDDSPGDVIAADPDGTITLDDGITTWNPLRALAFLAREALAGDAE